MYCIVSCYTCELYKSPVSQGLQSLEVCFTDVLSVGIWDKFKEFEDLELNRLATLIFSMLQGNVNHKEIPGWL